VIKELQRTIAEGYPSQKKVMKREARESCKARLKNNILEGKVFDLAGPEESCYGCLFMRFTDAAALNHSGKGNSTGPRGEGGGSRAS